MWVAKFVRNTGSWIQKIVKVTPCSLLVPSRFCCRARTQVCCGSTPCPALRGSPTTAGASCGPTVLLPVPEVSACWSESAGGNIQGLVQKAVAQENPCKKMHRIHWAHVKLKRGEKCDGAQVVTGLCHHLGIWRCFDWSIDSNEQNWIDQNFYQLNLSGTLFYTNRPHRKHLVHRDIALTSTGSVMGCAWYL